MVIELVLRFAFAVSVGVTVIKVIEWRMKVSGRSSASLSMARCRSNFTKPLRALHATPISLSSRVHHAGCKVFVIRWDRAGGFEVIHYDQDDWDRTLRAWATPRPCG